MNKIHSGVLALVLGIFLIQAADPPYEKSANFLPYTTINHLPVKNLVTSTESSNEIKDNQNSFQNEQSNNNGLSLIQPHSLENNNSPSPSEDAENLRTFHDYLKNIKSQSKGNSDDSKPNKDVINEFLQRQGKSEYEKLLERDFIRPLLKLYQNKGQQQPAYIIGNFTNRSRISKEDYVDNDKFLTRSEFDLLVHETDNYYENLKKRGGNIEHLENRPNIVLNRPPEVNRKKPDDNKKFNRRDDRVGQDTKNEHIGEILPPNFNKDNMTPIGFAPNPFHSEKVIRKPITFPGDRFRPEYEPTAVSYEGFESNREDRSKYVYPSDLYESSSSEQESRNIYTGLRIGPPPSEIPGYRVPRRLRGHSDSFPGFQITGRDTLYEPSTRWQNGWTSSRKPRVIFPTDLVAFRDSNPVNPNQDEPDWLAPDNTLQDIQETDTRERGE
ncbi:hypothetical protein HHI36_000927 [Cryptolaemus montrouzieri]|uniref:Uncharacterized protein n=1 Tax=Cryptolaemus montrouzieri TaxID=559131 RepID=A0ABD2P6F3_9CUCU